ncbi:MAG: hypothetical protein AB1505_10585 [Candidatus Latescibacterota bacterium]
MTKILASAVAGGGAAQMLPVVLENELARISLSSDGTVTEVVDRRSGRNHAAAAVPMVSAYRDSSTCLPRSVRRTRAQLEVAFAEPEARAVLRVTEHPRYFTLTVSWTDLQGIEWLEFCRLSVIANGGLGTLLNVAWDDGFAVCVLSLSDRTHTFVEQPEHAELRARCYPEYGLDGARIAVIAAPREQLPEIIEEVEVEQGLPHPLLDGQWLRSHPGRSASYLMVYGLSEETIDDVIDFARGGFGCVEILNWWQSTPTYEPHRTLYPGGMAGLKACADKIHAAGMQVGLHCMQGMVGWAGAGMDDPYVTPEADPRLRQDRHARLAAAVTEEDTELPVEGALEGWPDSGDLRVDGEIVRYAGRTADHFLRCTRGLHRTRVKAHAAGTAVGHLVNCFPIWGHTIYAPDVSTSMLDEVCGNLARAFNATGADMAYFDGGEEVACQPPHWRHQGRIALGVMQRLRKPVFLGGNALYTNLSWHVISRGSPYYDPMYYGRDVFTLRCKGTSPARHALNLLAGDVGWFTAHVHSPSTHAVTPEEVTLLCLKALAGNAPISFIANAAALHANRRIPEMLAVIRACDDLKQRGAFSAQVRAALAGPTARHALEQTPEGGWAVRPHQFGPPRVLNAARQERSSFSFTNRNEAQRPWVRLRACTRLAAYGDPANVVLADGAQGIPLAVDGTTEGLECWTEPSAETPPAGGSAFTCAARNAADRPSQWCRLSLPFASPLDLLRHRRLGVWVHAEGTGGVLNVQLGNQYNGAREHYVDLDFAGWRYFELDLPEDARYYDYTWPYAFPDVFYRPFDYGKVTGLHLYLNAVPPRTEVRCLVGRIEALAEDPVPLVSPSLQVAGRRVTFPVSLAPDEYVEQDWDGTCRHFEPNGGLIRVFEPEGEVVLASGDSEVALACAPQSASPRAEVTLATRGPVLATAPPALPKAARR